MYISQHLPPEYVFLINSISAIFMGEKKCTFFISWKGELRCWIKFSEGIVEREALALEMSSGLCGPCSSIDFTVWPWTNELTSLCLRFSTYTMEIMKPTTAYLIGTLWGQMGSSGGTSMLWTLEEGAKGIDIVLFFLTQVLCLGLKQ